MHKMTHEDMCKARIGKNILLMGPTGSGKSFTAKKMAGSKDTLFISLCPNTTYETLVDGISIDTGYDGISYSNKNGLILDFLKKASINREKSYHIVLDDIQNILVNEVMGELLYAFSNRDAIISLKSGNEISVPPNVELIVTATTSDFSKQSWRSYISFFDITVVLDNTKNTYIKALGDIRDNSKFTVTDDKFKKIVERLANEYDKYVDASCVFTPEYVQETENFRLGYTFFLPNNDSNYDDWLECVKHKIHHQVIPLLHKYADDGVIYKKFVPDIHETDTDYEINERAKSEINIIEQPSGQCKMLENEVFINGLELTSRQSTVNSSHRANRLYIALFRLIRDVIENPIINDDILCELLLRDSDILTWRNDVFNNDTGIQGGCLFVNVDVAHLFPVKDKAQGNTKGGYAYSKSYNFISYNKRKYVMFSAYNIADRKIKLPRSIFECIETNIGIQKREFYKTAKMFAFKYLSKVKEHIESYLRYNPNDSMTKGVLNQLDKDMKIVANLTDNVRCIDDNFYIDLSGDNNDERVLKAKYFVDKIRKLPTWANLADLNGVYRTMSNRYEHIMNLTGIKQLIFQGPPGTSKTYGAKKLICDLAGIEDDNWEEKLKECQLKTNIDGEYSKVADGKKCYWDIVQFHPSYSYEDFVRGISVFAIKDKKIQGKIIRPCNDNEEMHVVLEDSNAIGYKAVNKVIGKMARIAEDTQKKCKENGSTEVPVFVLIVDEINRANLASVFGELIYALEYRDNPINTPYTVDGESSITIPSNLYIIGTMNTADKSIGDIDYAIRRRFLFFKFLPDLKVVVNSIVNTSPDEDLTTSHEIMLYCLINVLFDECVNSVEYEKNDVQIGHTYFIRKDEVSETAKETIKLKFIYQIIPILNEYVKDGVLDFDLNDLDSIWYEPLSRLKGILQVDVENQENLYDELITSLESEDIKDYLKSIINECK